ncbi:hypothetical protein R1flu_024175 [Riccia fluitans]|uniref:Uncharacterized protein n=1 Tax=Riccia fluitans TaxID=41844 RepID=A0ABD1XUZ9_9MARC
MTTGAATRLLQVPRCDRGPCSWSKSASRSDNTTGHSDPRPKLERLWLGGVGQLWANGGIDSTLLQIGDLRPRYSVIQAGKIRRTPVADVAVRIYVEGCECLQT